MTKQKSPSLLENLMGKAALDRVQAAKLYFSGELDSQHALAVTAGDAKWRVLRYQRVVDPEKVSYPISKLSYIRPDTFEKHLKYLSKHCRIVPLDRLATELWENKEIADKTVAITFDGGWIDNFVYAYPLLLKYHAAATFFLPTAFIGTNNFFWHDKVLFAMIMMKNAGLTFQPFQFFSPEEQQLVRDTSPEGEITLPLIFIVASILAAHGSENRLVALTVLGQIAQSIGGDLPMEPAFMGWEDVRMMNSPLVQFGSLSHGHPRFNEIAEDHVREELRISFEILKGEAPNVSKGFAFPDGVVSADSLRICAELNIPFVAALDNGPPRNIQTMPPLIMKRNSMFEGETFATELLACKLWLPPPGVKA